MSQGTSCSSARHTPATGAAPAATDARPDPMPSEQLLRGRRLVEIAHNGEVYACRPRDWAS